MDILLQIIGYSFIPLIGILVITGIHDIYQGLKEHFDFRPVNITELPIRFNRIEFSDNFGFKKVNSHFCSN